MSIGTLDRPQQHPSTHPTAGAPGHAEQPGALHVEKTARFTYATSSPSYQAESRMMDSPNGVCAGQVGSNIQLLPYPLVEVAGRGEASAIARQGHMPRS
jgi:hypothetical protein